MITVSFQAACLSDLRKTIAEFLSLPIKVEVTQLSPMTEMPPDVEAPAANPMAPKAPDVEPFQLDVNKQPAKRVRRTKEQIAADNAAKDAKLQEVANGAQEEHEAAKAADVFQKPEAETEAPTVSKEGVHMALQEVNKSCGLNVAREILGEFKVNRISEITEAQYADFIAKCRTAVMMA